jgi:hypothetical protein
MASGFSPLLLTIVTLAACSNAPSAPAPDAGDPLGGRSPLEVCTEYCLLRHAVCGGGGSGSDCEKYCATQILDAKPFCEHQVGPAYACRMDILLSQGCDRYWGGAACGSALDAEAACLDAYACASNDGCTPSAGECYCDKLCKSKAWVDTHCVANSVGSYCECYVNGALVGSCEQSDLNCYVSTSCCAAYFDL